MMAGGEQKNAGRGPVRSFRDLDVWKNGMAIVGDVYRLTAAFPREETYGLAAQMRRSAVSIPSNIAEGFNRRHSRDYCRFLGIELGSCGELETQAEVSGLLDYLDGECLSSLVESVVVEAKMLRALIKSIESASSPTPSPQPPAPPEE